MKKIVLSSVVVLAVVSFMVWSKDPLNDIVNFIIAGSVPGTNVSIGMWSTLGLVGLLFYLVYRGFKAVKLRLLEHTAQQIKREQARQSLESTVPLDPTKRSVIAARNSEYPI